MCGIIGKFCRAPNSGEQLERRHVDRLAHRGPDASGAYADAWAHLAHRRLAIIDLSDAGRQPLKSADGRYVITFNGEIYNYLELRRELAQLGYNFKTQSDTEVLLAAFDTWKERCVVRFRGMFAFCIWDTATRTAFFGRDRCGEKPLLFSFCEERLVFASELKALLPMLGSRPRLNAEAVAMYLHYQYVPEPHTLLDGVRKLPAAHTMTLHVDTWSLRIDRYWSVEETRSELATADVGDVMPRVRDGIRSAVEMTLRSDVPVGVALSGGIDSGAIASFAQRQSSQPLHAFCVGYPGRPAYDERAQAKALGDALGMVVHEVELPIEDFVGFFPELVRIMDEPIADPAAFGHYAVPKAASESGIKVMLSGIGGDELFWGYEWVTACVGANQHRVGLPQWLAGLVGQPAIRELVSRARQSGRMPDMLRSWLSQAGVRLDPRAPSDQLYFYLASGDFADAFDLKAAVAGPVLRSVGADVPFAPTAIGVRPSEDVPAAIIRLLFETWLTSNCLTLGDRVSMAVGVESRMPFLDVELIELVMALRSRWPDHQLGQKAWMREALVSVLPPEVLARPKAGFRPPVREWLAGVVSRYGADVLQGRLVNDGLLDGDAASTLMRSALNGPFKNLLFAYKLVLLDTWCRHVDHH